MSNQTDENKQNNRGEDEQNVLLRSIWLGVRDSNPRSWDQNPVPYRLANSQYRGDCNKNITKNLVWYNGFC